jgi:glycosyltransferase involved in cell wall biosynthesis
MKLLIFSGRATGPDYALFANALNEFGIEATNLTERLYLSRLPLLHIVPSPTSIRFIKRFAPDLVLADSPYYIPEIAKLTGRKIFYHMLGDLWTELNTDKTNLNYIFGRMHLYYLNAILGKSIQDTDFVLANSKWLLNIVKKKIPTHQANLLYTGIDANEWMPEPRVPQFFLKHPAVVGVFDFNVYQKVLGLIKFAKVIKKMPNVNFYFVGNGPYFNLARQSCPPNMFLMGRVSQPEVKKVLASGDIFVHPAGLDVLPRSVKEASLMEKPIIASNVGGIPEIVRNNQTGYLCEIDDVDEWVEKIGFLLDNPDVARGLGKNARRFVMETFGWRRIAEGFLETLKAFRA